MRLAADTAIHALRLLKHAQDNAHDMSVPAKLAMYLPMASHPMMPQPGRRLEEVAFPDEGDASGSSIALTQSGGDDFAALMENEYMDKIINQCHVNVEGLVQAAVVQQTALQSGGQQALAMSMMDPTYLQNLQAAFGDFDGQPTCAANDLMTLSGAAREFMTCTGIDTLIGKVAVSGFDAAKMEGELMQKCAFLQDPTAFTSVLAAGEESSASSSEPSQEQLMVCLGAIFAENNPIGDYLRDLYEHTNKYCSCMHDLGEKVPECIMEENGMKISTSLIKSATCVFGVGCGAYKDWCGEQTATLEKCLPGIDEEYDCTKVMVDCAKDGAVFTALPHVVSHHLPDICQDVAQESTIAKFESFQEKCAGKKDFLALAQVIGEEDEAEPKAKEVVSEEDVDEIKMEEAHIIEEEEDLKEEQKEIMEELKSENAEKSLALEGEVENEEEDTSHASLPMAGIVIVACAVVASLVVIKKKFSSSKPQKTDFAPVSDGGFEYEEEADAGNFIA